MALLILVSRVLREGLKKEEKSQCVGGRWEPNPQLREAFLRKKTETEVLRINFSANEIQNKIGLVHQHHGSVCDHLKKIKSCFMLYAHFSRHFPGKTKEQTRITADQQEI